MSGFKVGIIGIGHVGAHVLEALAVKGLADSFVLVDLEEKQQKVIAERQDVLDSTIFLPHKINVNAGSFADLADCDVIVNCVGDILALQKTHNRLDELIFNVKSTLKNAPEIKRSGFSGIFINVSNPCDVITKLMADYLGLPEGRVFGTGTFLDTARLKLRLQEKTGVDAKSISAYMIGEHGNKQITAWSAVNFSGLSLDLAAQSDSRFDFDRDELEKSAAQGGWITYNGKFCTEYAIAQTVAELVRIVKFDEKAIVPVSVNLNGKYGESGIFAGVPARVGRNGVEEVIELSLTDKEKERFHTCCEGIRGYLQEAQKIRNNKE